MNYYDDAGFAYPQSDRWKTPYGVKGAKRFVAQEGRGLISAPDRRREQLGEEQARRDYRGLLERDMIGIEPYALWGGRATQDPDVGFQLAPMDVLPAGAGAKALGLLSSAIPVGMIGQLAYHGGRKWAPEAGARLGRPRLENVGEGSGGSAYGHGLNVSDSPRVAQSYRDAIPGREGYSYKMDVPDDDVAKMLDFDTPFSDYPPDVQKIIREIYKDPWLREQFTVKMPQLRKDTVGWEIYRNLQDVFGKTPTSHGLWNVVDRRSQAAASKYLASKGIPGLRHADAVGDPPIRNMVIWDEDLLKRIKVLERE